MGWAVGESLGQQTDHPWFLPSWCPACSLRGWARLFDLGIGLQGSACPQRSPQGAGVRDTCSPQDRKMGLLVAKASMGDPARGQKGVLTVPGPQARFLNWIPGAPPAPGPLKQNL